MQCWTRRDPPRPPGASSACRPPGAAAS
jgi:hypothetical protein